MFNIQRLDSTHISSCLRILNLNFNTPWKELDTVFNSSTNYIYGVFMGNALVGFLALSTILDESEILMCAVDPDHHKKGLATALIDYALIDLKRLNINVVFLEVDDRNVPAQGLYAKIGFQPIGRRNAYYLQPDGSYNDAIVMRRDV